MDIITEDPFKALNHKKFSKGLKGVGAIMEAINNNSVMYELLLETRWHNETIDLDEWLAHYTTRRYGKENQNLYKAWQILRRSAYGKNKFNRLLQYGGTSESILCARPKMNIDRVSDWGTSKLYYNPLQLRKAWTLFIDEVDTFKNNEGFQYDLVDLSRQILANHAQTLYKEIISAYKLKNKKLFKEKVKEFLELIDDQDALLSSQPNFMLGRWLEESKRTATNNAERKLFEYNARTQITTWSYQDTELHEYAHKEWSGLLSDFYKPRWEMFFNNLQQKLDGKNPPKPDYPKFEKEWTKKTDSFPAKAVTDPINQSLKMYNKYYTKIKGIKL